MADFIFDQEVRNPYYPGSLAPKELTPGVQLLTFDTKNSAMSTATIAKPCQRLIRHVVVDKRERETLITVPELVAVDVRGRTLSISRRGIHPCLESDEDWFSQRFSVLVS